MVAAIAEVTEVFEGPQVDWKTVASSDHAGSTWFMRRHGARMVRLQHLQAHGVYEELSLPQGIKPLSLRWVDKVDYSTAKARLTATGYEQELTGQENFDSATPLPATLRLVLVVAQPSGLAVAVRDCARVTPPLEGAVEPGRACRLLETLPSLKGGLPGDTTRRRSRKSSAV